jgi:YVTN family beta-propeller protein
MNGRSIGLTAAVAAALTLVGVVTAGGASAVVGTDSSYVQVATVGTGTGNNGAVAVDQSTHRAYVAGYQSNTIAVIDTATNAQVATFAVGATPQGLSVDEASDTLWVAESNGNAAVELDATTGAVLQTIPVSGPQSLVYDPVSGDVYVTRFAGSSNVYVFDAATGAQVTTIPSGSLPSQLAVNPAAHQVYVGNAGANSVSIIDTATQTLVSTVALPAMPQELAVDTTSGIVYVSLANNTVARIDPTTGTIIDSFAAPGPRGISVNSAEGYLAITSSTTPTVNLYSMTGTLLQAVPVTSSNWKVGIDLANSTIVVSALSGPSAYVLQETPVITSPAPPAGVQGTPYTFTVTASGSPTLTFSITSGALPSGLTLDPSTGVISGTPTLAGSYTFTVTASNAAGTDSATYTLDVTAPAVVTPPPAAPPAAEGPSVNTGGSVVPSGPPMGAFLITLGGAVIGAIIVVIARRRQQSKL